MSELDDQRAEQKAADEAVRRKSRKHTRRSFAVAAAAVAAGWGIHEWIDRSPRLSMQPEPFRKAFQFNAGLSRAVFDDRALAPTYSLKRAVDLRVNGVYGLKQALVPASWRLQVTGVANARGYPQYTPDVTAWEYRYSDEKTKEDQGHDTKVAPSADTAEKMAPKSMVAIEKIRQERTRRMPRGLEEAGESRSTLPIGTPGLLLTLDDIVKLPKHDLVTQFKCIEGWSQIVHWTGVRMSDFIAAYPPQKRPDGSLPRYVYLETPNGDYYVGYDMHVCMHPQTLLVTEMSGSPLTQYHGAPLRLHAPTKYGYKQIKRIGLIAYMDEKPDDYWTKLGYDWYAGL
ncbi:MAG TPA: molybdopterin-dependent oxidoreductase [Acidobacteriaceae bacterium]|nr:molybdopterin-dependent oxidoreductase [Acidobacteriaceae bacterium]